MDYQEAIKEAETQIGMYESIILYNKDFEPKNDNSNYERKMDFLKTVIYAMQELQQYKQLCALEEVSNAVEKQKEECPIAVLSIFGGKEYECKNCGSPVEYFDKYCRYCGQRLDWSEER